MGVTPAQQASFAKALPAGSISSHVAVVDKFAVSVSDFADGATAVRAVIDTVRGRRQALALPAEAAALVDAARARRDSVAMIMDADAATPAARVAGTPHPFAITGGFARGRATLRFAVPLAPARRRP